MVAGCSVTADWIANTRHQGSDYELSLYAISDPDNSSSYYAEAGSLSLILLGTFVLPLSILRAKLSTLAQFRGEGGSNR